VSSIFISAKQATDTQQHQDARARKNERIKQHIATPIYDELHESIVTQRASVLHHQHIPTWGYFDRTPGHICEFN
jgi:hypothetical protein